MKSIKLLIILLITLALNVSCKKDDDIVVIEMDLCENVTCFNGGNCVTGTCECPSGYSGEQCELYTPVVVRLLNETPLELVESGISIDSLHGKLYAGGYIFYIDTEDIIEGKEGLVCALTNLDQRYKWGCDEEDIDLFNLTSDPIYPEETAQGARPGDGIMNTLQILNSPCASGHAADACANYSDGVYDDWFLPSRGGMFLIYYNLEARGHVDNFGNDSYWTSNEQRDIGAWAVSFAGGTPTAYLKASSLKVRPVRAF
ncbi:DUF1566 domain-containing protein [Lewinella cohaerens]|uniref:DUF1566 domain-containing protein n=1 Tax=Lewinella cohaerens TaxID=70995 RepID=UPI00039A0AD7|nr:DUF1566 domain-containing protein [Lewinella cohaerens]